MPKQRTRKKTTIASKYETLQCPKEAGILSKAKELALILEEELNETQPGARVPMWGAVVMSLQNEIERRT